MRIGINGRFLLHPNTGIGQYTLNLLKILPKIDSESEYTVCVPQKVKFDFPKNVKIEVVPEMAFGSAGMKKTHWEQIKVPAFFEKMEVDAAIFPYPCNPWSFSWLEKGIKTLVVVHDVIPWTDRRYLHGVMSGLYHWQTKKAVKSADKILTVSETSKKMIAKVCGVSKKKIFVAYNDVADTYKKNLVTEKSDKILKKLKLSIGKYVLYVGGFDVRKNVKFLVSEYKASGFDMPLCLVGGKQTSFEGENIVSTGVLDQETLAALYTHCFCFVNLSESEGFNVPILEAENRGIPAIISDIEVHKELYKDAALLINLKPGKLAEALKKMKGIRVRNKLITEALKNKEKYNWITSVEIIKNLLNS